MNASSRLAICICVLLSTATTSQNLPNAPSTQKQELATISKDTGWPRTLKDGTQEFVIYQPQVDRWDGNRIYLYSAVEMKKGAQTASQYGVVWFSARTEVDKVNRLVTLDTVDISKVNFPTVAQKNDAILAMLKAKMPGKTKIISLDRLEAGVRAASPPIQGVSVKNDPPKIVFSTRQSVLVTIDGDPKLAPVKTTDLQRVINTKSILLFADENKKYYLRLTDWWLESTQLDGPWKYASNLPADMKKADQYIAEQMSAQGPQPDAVSGQPSASSQTSQPSLKRPGEGAEIPAVYVVYAPTELIETKGEPKYAAIPGTSIEYVSNTTGTVLRYGGEYYVLISGRWFKSPSLSTNWTFVDAAAIPTEFAKIPPDSPKASALASIPNTPQAEEGLIANSIPQTATITRSEAKLTVVYDGEATFVPIESTSMTYARNTSAPVIKVGERYYSVESGVWFWAPTPQGPWNVADKVPDEIYTIPASSPLHYVTYAKVYGSSPEVVYIGYTPGYYGTVVSSSTNTVVYGTGWYYPPYVGPTVWYGYPYTYGVGAGFTWTDDSGWSVGFGYGYYWYYPWYSPWWGPMCYYPYGWYPYYGWGAWGGAAVANVYGRWGNAAYSRTAAAWANPYTGNYGAASRGGAYNTQTGRIAAGGRGYNTNIYTGNTAGYRGGAVYDPKTGIVAGGGAGFAGNIYTGQGAAGSGRFIYNTNTDAGIAAGKNNVYAGKDGTLYRYNRNTGNWSQNTGNGWQAAERPGGGGTATPYSSMQRQQQARTQGAQRSQNFNSMRSAPTMRAPMRMGGRRR